MKAWEKCDDSSLKIVEGDEPPLDGRRDGAARGVHLVKRQEFPDTQQTFFCELCPTLEVPTMCEMERGLQVFRWYQKANKPCMR